MVVELQWLTVRSRSPPALCYQEDQRPPVETAEAEADSVVTAVPEGSPSRGGDVTVYAFDMDQPSMPTPVYSVLESISVFMALSPASHSINSPDNSSCSHSVLLVCFLPCWSFRLYISFKKVSLNGFRDPVRLPCAATRVRERRDPGD